MKTIILGLLLSTAITACAGASDVSASNEIATEPAITKTKTAKPAPTSGEMAMTAVIKPMDEPAVEEVDEAIDEPVQEIETPAKETFAETLTTETAPIPLLDVTGDYFKQKSNLQQGGLAYGITVPNAKVTLDGVSVYVDDQGRYLLGFGRDHGKTSTLKITAPDGRSETHKLDIADKHFPEQRIDGIDQSKVSGYTPAQIKVIQASTAKKKEARTSGSTRDTLWGDGFVWPAKGRISGVFGARRILNGEKKRPHSGTDVAAPTGDPVFAPTDGIITLAEHGMYFEGGLIFIDHGHDLESAMMHLSKIDVKKGDYVTQGQKIGEIGATGRVTGPHLHWSLKWKKTLVDAQLVMGTLPN